jgi:hypothetical protein
MADISNGAGSRRLSWWGRLRFRLALGIAREAINDAMAWSNQRGLAGIDDTAKGTGRTIGTASSRDGE